VKVAGDSLSNQLAKGLSPIYLIAGDEILLVNEAADAIRARARQDGFTERELHFVERGFDWAKLRAASRTLSLFAERKLIELRMPSGAPGEQGAELLIEMAEERAPDTLVLVITGKLDGKTQNAKWVSAIEKHGTFVQVWPIDLPKLPVWIRERLARHGLRADDSVAQLLAERTEGNLLAAHQEVEKLSLLLPPGPVTLETALEVVADSARYDVLQVGEAAMRGQAARALHILHGLQADGTEPPVVLWALNKDLQWIARAEVLMRAGHSADHAMNSLYVWKSRQPAMRQALARLSREEIAALLVDAESCDRAIKGLPSHVGAPRIEPWLMLEAFVARLAGVRLARAA
jgi:DNA polymerase-3 subunit delta